MSRAAIAAPARTSAPRPSDLLLDAFSVLVGDGRRRSGAKVEPGGTRIYSGKVSVGEGLRWLRLAVGAAAALWDDESWDQLVVVQLQIVRDTGSLSLMPFHLQTLALTSLGTASLQGRLRRS